MARLPGTAIFWSIYFLGVVLRNILLLLILCPFSVLVVAPSFGSLEGTPRLLPFAAESGRSFGEDPAPRWTTEYWPSARPLETATKW